MASPRASGHVRHLRLVTRRGSGGTTVYGLVVGAVWLAIVWLLFVSFVDEGNGDRSRLPARPSGGRVPASQVQQPSGRTPAPASTAGG